MSRKRASKAVLVKRREEVQKLILEGKSKQTIVSEMSEKWETSKRAIQEDIRIIGKEWAETAPENTVKLRNQYDKRLEMLFNLALEKGNIKNALEIQKEINKLNGLYKSDDKEENNIPDFIEIGRKAPLRVVDESSS